MCDFPAEKIHIIDLRHLTSNDELSANANAVSITDEIIKGLEAPLNDKTLPTLLLYDERGLRLYDKITTDAPEYYPFGAEEEIFREHAFDIVQVMHKRIGGVMPGEVVLELGAGALRKTSYILHALSELVPKPSTGAPISYFALDLEERELKRTLSELHMSDLGPILSGKVETRGLLGTYESGLQFITHGGLSVDERVNDNPEDGFKGNTRKRTASESSSDSTLTSSSTEATSVSISEQPTLHLMFLGSSIGNFPTGKDAEFLRPFPLRPGSGDTFLLGLSHDTKREDIELSYNDPEGHTRKFIMNGLRSAGNALGDSDLFNLDNWEYVNWYDEDKRIHEAYYKCVRSHQIQLPGSDRKVEFLEGELVNIEVSRKYSESDMFTLFTQTQFRPIQRWVDSTDRHSLVLLERPPFVFQFGSNLSPAGSCGPFSVPTVKDWETAWTAWDFVTLRMIPPSMLYKKPIDLRHICLFYLGHIPAFLDIHLSSLLKEPNTEPVEFKRLFERGIDPNVDDPTQCHDHPEVPQVEKDWPSPGSILSYRLRVRERLLKLYDDISSGKIQLTRSVARVLFMTYEHEAMHLETLLYMLIQRAGIDTIPPPDFTPPPWESLLESWNAAPKPAPSTVVIDATTVTIGIDDIENEDNNPVNSLEVNGHVFGWDNESPKEEVAVKAFRIEWRPVTNGEFFAFYKNVTQAVDDKSKSNLTFPASWVIAEDGEIQVRTLYGPIPMNIAWDWPVITSYDNLSSYAIVKGGRIPTEPELRVFLDMFSCGYNGGSNNGFRNWHPIPATTGLQKNDKKGHNGGVWEWTSTVMVKRDGFVPSSRYPGYSADFFDGAHNVVLGSSYATIPRIAERRSFRNWYQRNYPYAWVGGRVAYDLK